MVRASCAGGTDGYSMVRRFWCCGGVVGPSFGTDGRFRRVEEERVSGMIWVL